MTTAFLQIAMASFLILPLAIIAIINLAGRKLRKNFILYLGAAGAIIQMLAAVYSYFIIWQNRKDFIDFSLFWDIQLNSNAGYFSLDFLSLVVIFSIGILALAAVISAKESKKGKELSFLSFLMLGVLGINGMVMVRDLFSLYLFLEITAIASIMLIALKKDKESIAFAFKAFIISAIASVFMLIGFAFIIMLFGSLRFVDIPTQIQQWQGGGKSLLSTLCIIFLVVGLSVKAGLVPFHSWFYGAFEKALTPVFVMLVGIITVSAGAYAIIRLSYSIFPELPAFRYALGLFAIISIIYGALTAFWQKDFKSVLVHTGISQIGFIVLGAACGNAIGVIGAVLHIFNYTTFNSSLLINCTLLENEFGTTNLNKLAGRCGRRLPLVSNTSLLAFSSAAGIPPMAGFWSKLLIIIAVWQSGFRVVSVIAVAASLLTLGYFLLLYRKIFSHHYLIEKSEIIKLKGIKALFVIILAVVTLVLGIIFPFFLSFLQSQGLL